MKSPPSGPVLAIARRALAGLPRVAMVAACTLVLLAPALWNRFPFMFYDTAAFIHMGFRWHFALERQPTYGWSLRAFGMGVSVWLPIVVQSVIIVLLLQECARLLAPRLTGRRFVLLVLALGIGTGLPWFTGQYMPDVWAPIMVIALYLLGFHAAALSWPRRAALLALVGWSATVHGTHLGLCAGLVATIGVMQALAKRKPLSLLTARPSVLLPAIGFASGLAVIVAVNYSFTGELFVNRAAPNFILGRLIGEGVAKRLLDETCPASRYRLCPYRDHLPTSGNGWLWGPASPFNELGRFEGMRDDATRMIADSFRRYPAMNIKLVMQDTFRQFFSYETGRGSIAPLRGVGKDKWAGRDDIKGQRRILYPSFQTFIPNSADNYRRARQQMSAIPFAAINHLHEPVAALSLIATVAIIGASAWRRLWDQLFFPLFTMVALLGNAFLCAIGSEVFARYQSRLVWLPVFAVLLVGVDRSRWSAPAAIHAKPDK